jgi:methyltransferase of ATP-grasp peptide maturase system
VLTVPEWRSRAAALADAIAAAGNLHDPAWRTAVEQVPRHVLVPRFHVQRGGEWITVGYQVPGWIDEVYRDVPLVTALLPSGRGRSVIVSSSTKPGLMVRMLEALDVHDGHRVLEIGTGTGYNAALLSHRLGAEAVFSVDIAADLVVAARDRLAGLGFAPVVATANGGAGFPAHAPYDRIIATCSVPAVPWAWAEQLRPGGLLLTDVKVGMHAGSLALLRRHADRLQGQFLPKWAGFMPMRNSNTAPSPPPPSMPSGSADASTTRIDPEPWTNLVPWFLAQAGSTPVTGFGRRGPDLDLTTFSTADGSWCEVTSTPDPDGQRVVRQGGPGRLWEAIERAHAEWIEHGRPGWERLGLTVTPDGVHRLWLGGSDTVLRRFS